MDQGASKSWAERLARGYEAAQNLSPAEKNLAGRIQDYYTAKEQQARDAGMFEQGRQNFATQVWQPSGRADESVSGTLNGRTAPQLPFGKRALSDNFFDAEQAGMIPRTKAAGDLLGAYSSEMNKAVATRQLVKDLSAAKADDGRPLASPTGYAERIGKVGVDANGKEMVTSPWVVRAGTRPDAKLSARDAAGKSPAQLAALENRQDYKTVDNPAFRAWKWVGNDDSGTPIMLHGDLALHPDIAQHIQNVLGKSAIREWYNSPGSMLAKPAKLLVKGVDKANGAVKQAMLSLSPFHYVQEATHAIGHRINPLFNLPKLSFDDPVQRDAAEHGLVLSGDHQSMENFREGLGSGSLLYRAPVVGRMIKPINEFLFNEYIPRLKLKTYDAILQRNQHVYASDLDAGRVTMDQVKYVSANQANAAYGHLNYTDIGRNPTLQHIFRLGLLAPDFLEARGKFAGQAAKGLVSKAGREQLVALATLAAAQYIGARVVNKNLDDDYHWDHPFSVIHNNREYSMRSVPEDLYKLATGPMRFANGRLSPLIAKTALEAMTGRNWRGEKVTALDTLAEAATSGIPIPLREAPGLRQLTTTSKNSPISPMESLLGSVGLHINRYSPISETYKLADQFKKAQGIPENTGSYPPSKYAALRNALDDADMTTANLEKQKLEAASDPDAVGKGFTKSVNHPFTGKASLEDKFRNSLQGDDRKMYDAAVARRALILDRFDQL